MEGSGQKWHQGNHGHHRQQTLQASCHEVSNAMGETLVLDALWDCHGAQLRGSGVGGRHGRHLSACDP